MARRKEIVTASFHYMARFDEERKREGPPLTQDDFEALISKMEKQEVPDLDDDAVLRRVRFGLLVPFSNLTREGDRMIYGTFEAPYSGHSFKNSEKGKISAESVNQRQFHFILYWSPNGRLYVGCQYLGNYGAYGTLSKVLTRMLPRPRVESYSFRVNSFDPAEVAPKEIRVAISKRAKSIAEDNALTQRSMISLQRQTRGDAFEEEARRELLPIFGRAIDRRKKDLAEVLTRTGLLEVKDEDIRDCVLIAEVDGRDKTFYLFDDGNFASKFLLRVPMDSDGHPEFDPTRKALRALLKKEIISRLAPN